MSLVIRGTERSNYETHPAVVEAFRGKSVLITGAAGSIGSELAQQVNALPVSRVVFFDRDENSLFELMLLFERKAKGEKRSVGEPQISPELIAVVGDIRDAELVRHVFREWAPDIVLHAAAYKHVTMMEANPCEAVLNNVTGTRVVAEAAIEFGCERFLLISTDKAVEPASVMGATKRVAELVVQGLAVATSASLSGAKKVPLMASVRFVNVIGSRGSVVPVFEQQIAAGGPVTLTDEEMTRFFMTVEQAARLLLEAATLPDQGCIYALETGEAVKIGDLARDMIRAAGFVPGREIAIDVTGIRAGEKLSERLSGDDEFLTPTLFAGIDRVQSTAGTTLDWVELEDIESAAQRRDSARVVALLRELPIRYTPFSIERGLLERSVANLTN